MAGTDCRFQDIYESVRKYFFPRSVTVPDHVRDLLVQVYPSVDWNRVDFRCGWPHILRRGGFHAITLPDPHSIDRINIYFTSDAWRPSEPDGLATIVHEGYHVLQIQQMGGGYGLGLARPFLVAYLAEWAGNGFTYADHPMEEAAYHVAGRPTGIFDRLGSLRVDEVSGDTESYAKLVQKDTSHTFWQHVKRSGPVERLQNSSGSDDRRFEQAVPAAFGAVLTSGWTVGWSLAVLVLAAAFLIVDLVGLLVTAVLWLVARIACGIIPGRSA